MPPTAADTPRKAEQRRMALERARHHRAGPRAAYGPERGMQLALRLDEVQAKHGNRAYRAMLGDDDVHASLGLLIAAALADDVRITPAVTEHDAPMEGVGRRQRNNDIKLAAKIADLCRRGLDRLERPLEEVIEGWMWEALPYGCSVAEQTYEEMTSGPDNGKWLLKSLTVLERDALGVAPWEFWVDKTCRVKQVEVPVDEGYGTERLPREKFGILSWKPIGNDPTGRSILRSCFNWWNLKAQLIGPYGDYLIRFADPAIKVILGEGNEPMPVKDDDGNDTGEVVYPLEYAEAQLAAYKGSSGLVLPNKGDAGLMEPTGEGGAYHRAFDRIASGVMRAILLDILPVGQGRPDLDGASAAIANVCRPIERAFRDDILYMMSRLNFGKDAADRLTPRVSFGRVDRANLEWMKMMAVAFQCQMLTAADRPAIRERLNLPQIPEGEEILVLNADGRPMGGPAAEPTGPGTLGLPLPPAVEEPDDEADA